MSETMAKGTWVEIEFDCLPLRTVTRLDVPLDASPKYEQFVLRVKDAMEKHGSHNAFFLHGGKCVFHLTNDPNIGSVGFSFEGTVLTGEKDLHTKAVHINTTLSRETCAWLNEPMVEFLAESVKHAVLVEFDRYIEAGDLEKTRQRLETIQAQSDDPDLFAGMYL